MIVCALGKLTITGAAQNPVHRGMLPRQDRGMLSPGKVPKGVMLLVRVQEPSQVGYKTTQARCMQRSQRRLQGLRKHT